MKSEKEMTDAITKLTTEIREKYPDMGKYIEEMPAIDPDEEDPEINAAILIDYYNNLLEVMTRYAIEHTYTSQNKREAGSDEKL